RRTVIGPDFLFPDEVRLADVASAARTHGENIAAIADAGAHDVDDAVPRYRRRAGRGGLDAVTVPELRPILGVEPDQRAGNVEHQFRLALGQVNDDRRGPGIAQAALSPNLFAGVLVKGDDGIVFDGGIDNHEILEQNGTRGRA